MSFLDNRWLTRAANLSFAAGFVLGTVALIVGSSLNAGIALLFIGVVLMAAQHANPLWNRFGIPRRRKRIAEKLTQQAHGLAACLRASAQEAAAESGTPTPADRATVGDWHRRFPGSQTDQDKAVAEVLRSFREPLYRLLDAAALAGIPVSDERGLLERLSTIEGAWELFDRLMLLAKTWAQYSPVEEVSQGMVIEEVHPVPERSKLLKERIGRGEELLAMVKSGDFFPEDLGMDMGAWVRRCWEVIPAELQDLYLSLVSDGRTPQQRASAPWEPDKEIELYLGALHEIARRVDLPSQAPS